MVYFFDSYAVMEILKGNPNYDGYKKENIILTKLNLFEIYYNLYKQFDERFADEIIQKYKKFVIDFDEDVIKEVAILRARLSKRNLSMSDCIGYILAVRTGVKFLTGDKEFEDLVNVEFVK